MHHCSHQKLKQQRSAHQKHGTFHTYHRQRDLISAYHRIAKTPEGSSVRQGMCKLRKRCLCLLEQFWHAQNDERMLTGSGDQCVHLWDTASARGVGQFRGHNGSVKSVCPHASNPFVFASGGSLLDFPKGRVLSRPGPSIHGCGNGHGSAFQMHLVEGWLCAHGSPESPLSRYACIVFRCLLCHLCIPSSLLYRLVKAWNFNLKTGSPALACGAHRLL